MKKKRKLYEVPWTLLTGIILLGVFISLLITHNNFMESSIVILLVVLSVMGLSVIISFFVNILKMK